MNITHPAGLPITHIVSLTFASSESIVILFVTPNQEASQMGGGGMAGAAGWLAGWLDDEPACASLPDKRLERRLRRLLDQLLSAPGPARHYIEAAGPRHQQLGSRQEYS